MSEMSVMEVILLALACWFVLGFAAASAFGMSASMRDCEVAS